MHLAYTYSNRARQEHLAYEKSMEIYYCCTCILFYYAEWKNLGLSLQISAKLNNLEIPICRWMEWLKKSHRLPSL